MLRSERSSTIPADEVKDPARTIPRAIVLGISIVTVFYIVTNVVLFAVRPYTQLASDAAPLASATAVMLGGFLWQCSSAEQSWV